MWPVLRLKLYIPDDIVSYNYTRYNLIRKIKVKIKSLPRVAKIKKKCKKGITSREIDINVK